MQTKLHITIASTILLLSSNMNVMASNASGTINFYGSINSTSCNLEKSNLTISLPPINKSDLPKYNNLATENTKGKEFEIVLKDCGPSNKTTELTITSNNLSPQKNILMNTDNTSSAANNVGISIHNNNAKGKGAIILDESRKIVSTIENGTTTYKFYANYAATGLNPTSGKVAAIANFNIIYK
ncbi:fimbrial protein [Proteus hauseri]|uniref:fimbrial protein n=1 Tax=Proteus hauseri TaxID=183417 RepID=UPI0010097C7B|nr:fimbrial protein [Proteus hauseri]QAV24749.1 type 1 fimbrial protein [Proteus hauseri]